MSVKVHELFGRLAEQNPKGPAKRGLSGGIETLIKTGTLPPGSALPESRELANIFNVSVSTIQSIMNELTLKGLIWRKSRVGTFVADWQKSESSRANAAKRVAFVCEWARTPNPDAFFQKYFAALMDIAHQRNYEVILKPFDVIGEVGDAAVPLQERLNVDALIISSPSVTLLDRLAALAETGTRLLVLHGAVSNPQISCVNSDNKEACLEATRHLISLGHRRICLLSPARLEAHASYRDRLAGVREALTEARLDQPRIIEDNQPEELRALLAEPSTDKTTAIIDIGCSNVFEILSLLGARVPEDLSVISYDQAGNYTASGRLISAIDQPLRDMVVKAFDLIPQLADGSFQVRLRQRYLRGQTVGPAACE